MTLQKPHRAPGATHAAKSGGSGLAFPKAARKPKEAPRRIKRGKSLAKVRAERKAAGAGCEADTWEAILRWYADRGYRCAYHHPGKCSGRIVQDHVRPLAKDGKHEPQNLVPACEAVNFSKGTTLREPLFLHPYRSQV
jgi:hypothetical protein